MNERALRILLPVLVLAAVIALWQGLVSAFAFPLTCCRGRASSSPRSIPTAPC
jgi:hypothetical protein